MKHKNKNNINRIIDNNGQHYIKSITSNLPVLSKNPKERQDAVNRMIKLAETNLVVKNESIGQNPGRIIKDPTNKYSPDKKEENK